MSYLADPPDNPIDIDGDVEYDYVIPQQGALDMSVDTDADFDFVQTFGSPAMLRLTFTGATDVVPIYKTVTIRLQMVEGEVTHTPNFRILPTSGSQRVPNITNGRSKAVAQGATLHLKTLTDITADSFSATNLPATLSLASSTGRITGTAPADSGFYVVTVTATKAEYHYSRYVVLIVGTGYAPVSQPFFAFPDL